MKALTIGRSSQNDITISDAKVSRIHCQIIQHDNGRFSVVDSNSKLGTFVNGKKITGEVTLNPGDELRIGSSELAWQTYFKAPKPVHVQEVPQTPYTPPQPPQQPIPVQLPPLIPPAVKLDHNQKIEHFHGEVMKKGDDFQVPFKRNMGHILGNTMGCLASVAIVAVILAIAFMTCG